MRAFADALLRVLAVASAIAGGLLAGDHLGVSAGIGVGVVSLVIAGALADRWWAATVVPCAWPAFLVGFSATGPGSLDPAGYDVAPAYLAALGVGASVVAGAAVGLGVLLRRVVVDGFHGAASSP